MREVSDLRVDGRGGNPLDVSQPDNPDGKVTLAYLYDGNSRLTGIIDDNGNRTSFAYEATRKFFEAHFPALEKAVPAMLLVRQSFGSHRLQYEPPVLVKAHRFSRSATPS